MKKILFADNNESLLSIRSSYLKLAGYEVFPALNTEDATRVALSRNIDIAIIDIRLEDDDDPFDESGLVLAASLADKMPVIVLTAYPGVPNVKRSFQMGVCDFVSKLETQQAMVEAIKKTLACKNPRGEHD